MSGLGTIDTSVISPLGSLTAPASQPAQLPTATSTAISPSNIGIDSTTPVTANPSVLSSPAPGVIKVSLPSIDEMAQQLKKKG